MRTFRAFGREMGFELWTGWTDFKNWQLGFEGLRDDFKTTLLWIGPLHFAFASREVVSK